MMAIYVAIARASAASALSQAVIADRAGVSPKTVWNVLHGRNTHADALLAVARVVGLESLPLVTSDDVRR